MIASNIATLYRILGQMEESEKWIEIVKFSLETQRERTGIVHTGYAILMDGYDNLLGDKRCFKEALKMDEEAAENYLYNSNIFCITGMFYRIAWNSYEIAKDSSMEHEYAALRQKWSTAFQLSELLADYMNDKNLANFLKMEREKFLLC